MMRHGTSIAAVVLLLNSHAARIAVQEGPLPFSCATFGPNVDEGDLKRRFGSTNVTTGPVPWGGAEGDFNEGTILFADRADARLEIYWRDRSAKRNPEWIGIHGSRSRWQSTGGVMLGTDLKTVERLNGRPFRLNGWGTDLGGGCCSWGSGLLARQDVEG